MLQSIFGDLKVRWFDFHKICLELHKLLFQQCKMQLLSTYLMIGSKNKNLKFKFTHCF